LKIKKKIFFFFTPPPKYDFDDQFNYSKKAKNSVAMGYNVKNISDRKKNSTPPHPLKIYL